MTPRTADPQNAPERGSTRTVDRAFDLLEAVTAAGAGGASLTELARAADLSPATASRLLATLAGRGMIRRDRAGTYRTGLGLMQMAAVALRGEPLYELAGPHLVDLAADTGETANLGVAVDQDRALYLRQVAGDQRVQTTAWVGRTIPRDGTAMGAALAGKVAAQGYAVSRGSLEPDITSIAVPVRDYNHKIVAALSILAPSYRTSDEDAQRHGGLLLEHARGLSLALGG